MAETLLTPSSIKLFGRKVNDLRFVYDSADIVPIGANNFLQQQFAAGVPMSVSVMGTLASSNSNVVSAVTINGVNTLAGLGPGMSITTTVAGVLQPSTTILYLGPAPDQFSISLLPIQAQNNFAMTASLPAPLPTIFARIYAFSYEGALYSLPRPSIFLVHGSGNALDISATGYRSTLEQSGVIAREWEFAMVASADMRWWEYEKGDFSLRLDTEAGPFEQILLAAALRAGADMAGSGAQLGVRSGAQLSGAQLSGAQLSGAQLDLRNRR